MLFNAMKILSPAAGMMPEYSGRGKWEQESDEVNSTASETSAVGIPAAKVEGVAL